MRYFVLVAIVAALIANALVGRRRKQDLNKRSTLVGNSRTSSAPLPLYLKPEFTKRDQQLYHELRANETCGSSALLDGFDNIDGKWSCKRCGPLPMYVKSEFTTRDQMRYKSLKNGTRTTKPKTKHQPKTKSM